MSDRFDPRFDPAFQPGYEGPLASPPVAAAPAAAQLLPAAFTAAHPDRTTGQPRTDDDITLEPTRGVNPFIVALSVIAVVLIGAGISLGASLRGAYALAQEGGDFDFTTVQSMIAATPLLIILGIATAIGVLFYFAARWGRR